MPSIDVAMRRSVSGGVMEVVRRSIREALQNRDAISSAQTSIGDVRTSFSSWDNCMKANYCKWPVIALIIIGGLIIFSVIWCLARCLCCGLSCCCSCFQCLKCCGDCCGCCDPPKGKPAKYLDAPYIPPNQGYKSEEPMSTGPRPMAAAPATLPAPAAQPAQYAQYAEFDVSKRGHEDTLPVMPTWGTSEDKRIEHDEEEEAVEMSPLKKPGMMNEQAVPLMSGASPIAGPASPMGTLGVQSPYGQHGQGSGVAGRGGYGVQHDYNNEMGAAPGRPGFGQTGYGQSQSTLSSAALYGVGSMNSGPDRRTSPNGMRGGYNQPSPGGYNQPPGGSQGYNIQRPTPGYNAYDDGYGASHQDHRAPTLPNVMNTATYPEPQTRSPTLPNLAGTPYPAEPQRRSPTLPNMMGGGGGGGGSGGIAAYPEPQRMSPRPQQDYGNGPTYPTAQQPSRQYSNEPARQITSPRPQQQQQQQQQQAPSPVSAGLYPPNQSNRGRASPPTAQNHGGFDFNESGYSRPSTGRMPTDRTYQSAPSVRNETPQGQYAPYRPPQGGVAGQPYDRRM